MTLRSPRTYQIGVAFPYKMRPVVAFVRMAWSLSTNLERFFFATLNVALSKLSRLVSGCINFEKSAQSLVSGVWS